jgi:hypothetical protein
MSSTLKNLFVLLILILLGALAYFMFFSNPDSDIVSSDGTTAAQAAVQTREFKRILDDLNSIELESPLFEDRTFLSLTDFSQQIVDRPYGSSNPFQSGR